MINDLLKNNFHTPSYICFEKELKENLEILKRVKDESGAKILLSLKAFAMYSTFDLVKQYLDGCSSASLNETTLCKEYMKDLENHVYSPAYRPDEISSLANLSTHITFNSKNELNRYKEEVKIINENIKIAVRVNPELSFSPKEIYDPCSPNSRFGIKADDFDEEILSQVDGITMHALCEQNFDGFKRVVDAFVTKFAKYLKNVKYINFGGGHYITKKDYDIDSLIELLKTIRDRYDVQVYLEPGSAVAVNSGVLVTSVLDIIDRDTKVAILDTSAETHMPDVLAMPYRPEVYTASPNGTYSYELSGCSCLSGDIIGTYNFKEKLQIGDRIVFLDMMHYTMVKDTTFNGLNLPNIYIYKENGKLKNIKEFNYNDYKRRL